MFTSNVCIPCPIANSYKAKTAFEVAWYGDIWRIGITFKLHDKSNKNTEYLFFNGALPTKINCFNLCKVFYFIKGPPRRWTLWYSFVPIMHPQNIVNIRPIKCIIQIRNEAPSFSVYLHKSLFSIAGRTQPVLTF